MTKVIVNKSFVSTTEDPSVVIFCGDEFYIFSQVGDSLELIDKKSYDTNTERTHQMIKDNDEFIKTLKDM